MTNHSFIAVIINSITSALFAYVAFKFFFNKKLTVSRSGELVLKNKIWFAAWYGVFAFHSAFMVTPAGASVVVLGPLFVGTMAGWRCGLLTSTFGVAGLFIKAGLDYHSGMQYVNGYYAPTAIAVVLASVLSGFWYRRLNNKLPKIWHSTVVCSGFILCIEMPLVLLFPRPVATPWYVSLQYFVDLIVATSAGMAMMIIVIRDLLQERAALLETSRINGELAAVKAVQQGLAKKEPAGQCVAPNVDWATGTIISEQTGNTFFEHYYSENTRQLYFAAFTFSELSASATMAALVCKTSFHAMAKRAMPLADVVGGLQNELAAVRANRGQSSWFAGVIDVDSGALIDIAANKFSAIVCNSDGTVRNPESCKTAETGLQAGEILVVGSNIKPPDGTTGGDESLAALLAGTVTLAANLERLAEYCADRVMDKTTTGGALILVKWQKPADKLTLAIDLQEVGKVRQFVASFTEKLKLPEKVTAATRLTLEELTVNVIKYGFPNGCSSQDKIDILLRLEGKFLLVKVVDSGRAFNPLRDNANNPRTKKTVGGWGIQLVQKFAEKIGYEYRDGMNVISIAISTEK